jgi:hypothetical protein
MVEHAWSPVTYYLTGVVLPDKLEGENKIPDNQTMPPEEKLKKNAEMFDNAISIVNSHLCDKEYDGFFIKPSGIACLDVEQPYDDHKHLQVSRSFETMTFSGSTELILSCSANMQSSGTT